MIQWEQWSHVVIQVKVVKLLLYIADSKCEMGVILGTGTNACYYEKFSNITKYNGTVKGDGMIINMEWGAFGDGRNILPLTKMDKQLDAASLNPGKQVQYL